MLTVTCPNCRHRFSTAGCCRDPGDASSGQRDMAETEEEEEKEEEEECINNACSTMTSMTTHSCYAGGILVPHGYTSGGYTSGGGCFIKAPTITQSPIIIRSGVHSGSTMSIVGSEATEFDVIQSTAASAAAAETTCCPRLNDSTSLVAMKAESVEYGTFAPRIEEQRVATTCDLTGGSVTITTHTPDIQSDSCMIQSTDSGVLAQAPHIEIRPKLTGGGCLVQKRLSTEDEQPIPRCNMTNLLLNSDSAAHHQMFVNFAPLSGCSELPGSRERLTYDSMMQSDEDATTTTTTTRAHRRIPSALRTSDACRNCSGVVGNRQNLCQSSNQSSSVVTTGDRGGMQIHVNATIQLPANFGECRLNITATTTTTQSGQVATAAAATRSSPEDLQQAAKEPARVDCGAQSTAASQPDDVNAAKGRSTSNGSNDGAPTTPVSWLMPCPWSLDAEQPNREPNKLREAKELLCMSGWYHEDISWQQSESLLKNAPVGRWLIRDSSDSRYSFAVSVQTARGPTSIRIHHVKGGFRFDAEPSMALAMPYFRCPIKMMEYYVEYSKKMDEQRKEVWVDYSGQMYSQIYLTQPLLKEVKPLSHLARLVVNGNNICTEHLPLVLRNYITEYPYTL